MLLTLSTAAEITLEDEPAAMALAMAACAADSAAPSIDA